MTKIALILWAMDFMYGIGWTLVTIGILAVLGGCVFGILSALSYNEFRTYEDPVNYRDYKRFFRTTKKCCVVAISCFLMVAAIPSKCTCYAFMAGEISRFPAVQGLTSDAKQILNDVKVMIHKKAQEEK